MEEIVSANNFKEQYSDPGDAEQREGNFEPDPERTLVTPRFDEAAVLNAKPAVPLAQIRAQLTSHKIFIVAALLAGLGLGILGSILTVRYLGNPEKQTAINRQAQHQGDLQGNITTPQPKSSTADSQQSQEGLPVEEDQSQTPAPPIESSQPLANQPNEQSPGNEEEADQQPEEASSPLLDPVTKAVDEQLLRQAFHTWLKATNERDIDRQMSFYNAKMDAYYRTRGLSRNDVHSEKNRVFGRADKISIEADEPTVKISPDGRQATMRFRKRYTIEGESINRNGVVLQELRWQRVNGKWRIVSERDLKVLE
jgi:hypothetical protein